MNQLTHSGDNGNYPALSGPREEERHHILSQMVDGDKYKVGWGRNAKERLNAAGVNREFAKSASPSLPVGTKVIDAGKDEEKAWAHVAAYKGTEDKPILWMEDKVTMVFADLKEKLLWDWIDRTSRQNGTLDIEIGPDGRPFPSRPQDQLKLAKLFFNKRYFADRDALTHAQERAQRKVLAAGDWRNDAEREHEVEEIQQVRDMRQPDRIADEPQAQPQQPKQRRKITFTLDTKFTKGKQAGKTPRELIETPEGRQYLGWCSQNHHEIVQGVARQALAIWHERKKAEDEELPEEGVEDEVDDEDIDTESVEVHPATQIHDIVRNWPDVVDSEQIKAYEEHVGKVIGEPGTKLKDFPYDVLKALYHQVKKVDDLRESAQVRFRRIRQDKHAGRFLAIKYLNEKASEQGSAGIFDPVLKTKHLDAVMDHFYNHLSDEDIAEMEVF